MKKFINEVWTIQLPNKDIHISQNVDESKIKEFVKGKGLWGQNALYIKNTETMSVFDSTSEAENYINYVLKKWDTNLTDILSESQTDAEFNSIIHYLNMYKNGLVSPEGHICIPMIIPEDKKLELARSKHPEFDTLSDGEKLALLNAIESDYNTTISLFNSQ